VIARLVVWSEGEAFALHLLFKNLESFCFAAKFSSENLIV